MSDEAAFLNALKANPADDVTRLVYADWLDEHGEPQKAEYLRLVAVVARHDICETVPDAARLGQLAKDIPAEWRFAAGGRFALVLVQYRPGHKIAAIKWLREVTRDGLGQAAAAAEYLPHPVSEAVPFEAAASDRERLPDRQAVVANVVPLEQCPATDTAVYRLFIRATASRVLVPDPAARADAARNDLAVFLARVAEAMRLPNVPEAVLDADIVIADGLSLGAARTLQRHGYDLLPRYEPERGWWFSFHRSQSGK